MFVLVWGNCLREFNLIPESGRSFQPELALKNFRIFSSH